MNLHRLAISSKNDCHGFEKLIEIFQLSDAVKVTYDSFGPEGVYDRCEYRRIGIPGLIDAIEGEGHSKFVNRKVKIYNLSVYKK